METSDPTQKTVRVWTVTERFGSLMISNLLFSGAAYNVYLYIIIAIPINQKDGFEM